MCAQRLSASKIGSRTWTPTAPAADSGAQRLSASKIGSPQDRLVPVVRCFVLNACRRQRSVHSRTRLPISERLWRAQRLSASKIGSLQPGRRYGRHRFVLNACRRQRSVHDLTTVPADDADGVLNACRRQRSVHLNVLTGDNGLGACSTPVGVKDRFTSHFTARPAHFPVLNACRRQRSVHRGNRCVGRS